MDTRPRNIVIIGGGVIGVSTAYYLTRHALFNPDLHKITLLEASTIAAGASGKAGGLLALWAYPQCLVPLSYRLHQELAAEHGGAERWGYRQLSCGQITAVAKKATVKSDGLISNGGHTQDTVQKDGEEQADHGGRRDNQDSQAEQAWQKLPKQDLAAQELLHATVLPADLDWLDASVVQDYAVMGLPGYTDTAQVHPLHFTTAMAALAQERGVDIRLSAQVIRIGYKTDNSSVQSIYYLDRCTGDTHKLPEITDVVVAAGPWTSRVLPSAKVHGIRAHSVVFQADVSPYALFTQISLPKDWDLPRRAGRKKHKGTVDPEIYARPGGEVYVCGETVRDIPLPETADEVQCDDGQCDDMISYMAAISPVLGSAPIAAKQACYMPQHMQFGKEIAPLVGRASVEGLWVAAGHTCWGVQNAPGTALLISELIFDGQTKSANIEPLDPRKFRVDGR